MTEAPMRHLVSLILFALALTLFALPALAAGDDAKAAAGSGASVEGGVSLGGTGMGPGALGRGLDPSRPPVGMHRIPLNRKDSEERGSSSGSSARSRGDNSAELSNQAEKEEDAIRLKQQLRR